MTSAERQAALLDHKTRDFLVRQRTRLVTPEACLRHDTIRAHLFEFGIVTPEACLRHVTPEACLRHDAKGIHSEEDQKKAWGAIFPTNERLLAAADELPATAQAAVDLLTTQLRETQEKIDAVTARIETTQKTDPLAKRLTTIPGVGAITASAIAASRRRRASGTMPEVDNFRSARDLFVRKTVPRTVSRSYSPWLGLTPQPHSSGGKERLGRISKGEAPNAIRPREGPNNRYLRRLLYLGASCRRRASGTT